MPYKSNGHHPRVCMGSPSSYPKIQGEFREYKERKGIKDRDGRVVQRKGVKNREM